MYPMPKTEAMARPKRVVTLDLAVPSALTPATDPSAGEAVVQAAAIAAEQCGDEAEPGRNGEQQPHRGPQERPSEIERRVLVGGNDADAGRHLPERLPAGRERDEIADILNEEKSEQRSLRQDRDLLERDVDHPHREVHD